LDRRHILLGLVTAVVLVGLVGWLLGGDSDFDAPQPEEDLKKGSGPRLRGRVLPRTPPPPGEPTRPPPDRSVRTPAEKSAEEGRVFIQGTVHDEAGQPVGGIPIVATGPMKTRDSIQPPAGEPFTWSGSDGRFSGWIADQRLDISVGRVIGWSRPPPHHADRPGTPVAFVLRRADPLGGIVLNAAGRPLEHAYVTAFFDDSKTAEGTLYTDAEGRFTIQVPLDVRRLLLVATPRDPAATTGTQEARLVVDLSAERPREVVLRFDPGATIAGRVLGPEGEALPGVRLAIQRADAGQLFHQGASSDERGDFRSDELPRGTYWLLVTRPAPGYAEADPVLVSAPTSALQVVLRRSHRLQGRILDEDAGSFVVQWSWARRSGYPLPLVKEAKSRDDGSFEISDVPDGDTEMLVRRSGDDRCAHLRIVDPADEIVVRLVRGGAIAGRISLPDDLVWQHVRVTALGLGAWITEPVREDGSFRITGLPPGGYELGYEARGQRGKFRLKAPVEPGTMDLLLALPE
jgi:hypothetical protein